MGAGSTSVQLSSYPACTVSTTPLSEMKPLPCRKELRAGPTSSSVQCSKFRDRINNVKRGETPGHHGHPFMEKMHGSAMLVSTSSRIHSASFRPVSFQLVACVLLTEDLPVL